MKNFTGIEFGNKAAGFDKPTQLPRDDAQRRQWQSANKTWWETTPMRYDWRDEIIAPPGTQSYFMEIDRRFLSSACQVHALAKICRSKRLFRLNELSDKDVLEIGVGQGTHAQLLAPRCKSFTGIDLTSYAAEMTARRLKLLQSARQSPANGC